MAVYWNGVKAEMVSNMNHDPKDPYKRFGELACLSFANYALHCVTRRERIPVRLTQFSGLTNTTIVNAEGNAGIAIRIRAIN